MNNIDFLIFFFRFLDHVQLSSNDDDFNENENSRIENKNSNNVKNNIKDQSVKLLTLHASKVRMKSCTVLTLIILCFKIIRVIKILEGKNL